jgi:cyclopropane fatty-acyl-phospholipid synthase-like methyltransferase
VEAGYDLVADRYAALEAEGSEWPRMRWLDRLLERTRPGARVLDVGCGNGLPATRAIAVRFEATGVDVSAAQLERARRNVPGAKSIHGDVTELDFAEPFAAIAALYVMDHLPREQHTAIFARFLRWLEPGGHLLFSVEPEAQAGHFREWLGQPMFGETGFAVLETDIEPQLEGSREVFFLWVLAQSGGSGSAATR